MPWQPEPKMHVQLLVSHVRSRRKRWFVSAGSVNSTQTRGRSRGASATGSPYAAAIGTAPGEGRVVDARSRGGGRRMPCALEQVQTGPDGPARVPHAVSA